ncbi:hypothetical protein EEB14_45230 [Rhodococcus sp. WS4]|nr:hypothetical protein EEB14_45230 [Rhodococcus sp. WS4]
MSAPAKKLTQAQHTRGPRRSRKRRGAPVVRTPQEYSRRLASGAEAIVIDAHPDLWFDLGRIPRGVAVKLIGQSCGGISGGAVAAAGRCFLQVSNEARVTAYEYAHVEAFDTSTVDARGKSQIVGTDHSRIRAEDNAIVFAHCQCHVQASGESIIAATDTATVRLDGDAHVRASAGVCVTGPAAPANLTIEPHPISRLAGHLNL